MRWPAEWEPQAAVLIAWPHAGTDWADNLAAAEASYVALAAAVLRFQPLLVLVADDALGRHVDALLGRIDTAFAARTITVPYDDTWLRDSGPITLVDADGRALLCDFRFTGWGGKYAASQDDLLTSRLWQAGAFGDAHVQHIDWALEGGAVESDGRGSVLTTWQCLHGRHPDLTRTGIEAQLTDTLRAQRVLWLEHGHLEGDDTDAHIDTLARFAPNDTIVHQACDEPADSHFAAFTRMRAQLETLRTLQDAPYRLIGLPWPRVIERDGRRLPASYANYLVINDAVLVPAYDDPADAEAARLIGDAHPDRTVVPVPCRALIAQNGSLHCVTMQLPAAVVAPP